MQTISEFIAREGLTFTAQPTCIEDLNQDTRADIEAGGWDASARHWLTTITVGTGQSMDVRFSQGSGHTKPPTLEDVLDCIASDAADVAGRSFNEWADDLGYFPIESASEFRRAVTIYRAVAKQGSELKNLLGADGFTELLYETERK